MNEDRDPTLSRIEQSLREIEASLRRFAAGLANVRQQIANLPGSTLTNGGGDEDTGAERLDGSVAGPGSLGGPRETDGGPWLTLVHAGQIAEVHRGTIARLADAGKVIDNRQKGKQRRVSKASLLQWMGGRLTLGRQRAFADYERDIKRIPKRH